MTQSGKAHFYRLTAYDFVEAEAYLFGKEQSGEIYIHSKMVRRGKQLKRYAVFRKADEPGTKFIAGKSVLMRISDMEKIEK